MITSYIKYRIQSKNEFHIHSPFVYEFVMKVLNDKSKNADYDTIMRIGRLLDGKSHQSYRKRKIARLLYRIVRYFEPESVVSFGALSAINTTALALGHLQTRVYLEQSSDFLDTLNQLGIVNVNLIQPADLDSEKFRKLNTGFVFFAENDFDETEWDYLSDCLNYKTSESVFILEGIHKNRDMEEAWERIKDNEDVSLTIDLYHVGLVFFRVGFEKQDFVIRY